MPRKRRVRYQPADLQAMHYQADMQFKRNANVIMYWSVLLFLTILNFLAALILIPFLLSAASPGVFLIIIMLGLFFGYIFAMLVWQLEHLQIEHRIFAAIFVPFMTVLGMLTVVTSLNTIANVLRIQPPGSPLISGSVYVISFIMPYILLPAFKRQKSASPGEPATGNLPGSQKTKGATRATAKTHKKRPARR